MDVRFIFAYRQTRQFFLYRTLGKSSKVLEFRSLLTAFCLKNISTVVFWVLFTFFYKVFSVCPDFPCSLVQWFSPSSFHTHSLAPLPSLWVKFCSVCLHSGSRKEPEWFGSIIWLNTSANLDLFWKVSSWSLQGWFPPLLRLTFPFFLFLYPLTSSKHLVCVHTFV